PSTRASRARTCPGRNVVQRQAVLHIAPGAEPCSPMGRSTADGAGLCTRRREGGAGLSAARARCSIDRHRYPAGTPSGEEAPLSSTPDGGVSPPPGPGPDQGRHRRPVNWLGRLVTALTGLAAGMAVNNLSGTLRYRGLAGAVAVTGVVAAATWL